jgi:PAS domain S-box-containing protein
MNGDALLEESAEELYEEAPCGYLSTTLDGAIVRANRTFLRWCGYSAEELLRRRFHDLLPPGAQIYYETHYAPLLQMQGAVREIALEIVRADGSRLPVLVNAAVRNDADGNPTSVRIMVLDASDRRRYERELLEARTAAEMRALAATALAHVAEAVVVVDEDGRIALLNLAAERLFGVTDREARGLPPTAIAPGWDVVAERVEIRQPGDAWQPPPIIPLALGGDTRWTAVAGEAAPHGGTVYTLRDVTEERRLDEMRDDIVAIVSHELRTPLAGVYGAATTLLSLGDRIDADMQRRLVEVIGSQSERLAAVVENVLVTQRLDRGELSVEPHVVDLAAAAERAAASIRAASPDANVVVAAPEPVEAEGDPGMVEQVLVHLVDNAVKYGPRGGEVRIELAQAGQMARLTVSDAGPGVPEAERERIFEKFHRLDPAQRGGVGGTGLGLYIARELARRMGGRIGVLDGATSAFYVDLPRARG